MNGSFIDKNGVHRALHARYFGKAFTNKELEKMMPKNRPPLTPEQLKKNLRRRQMVTKYVILAMIAAVVLAFVNNGFQF